MKLIPFLKTNKKHTHTQNICCIECLYWNWVPPMVHCTHNHACLLIINLSEEEEKMLLNLVSHFRIVNFTVYLAMNKIFHCLNKTEMTTDHFKFTLKNIFILFLFFYFCSGTLSLFILRSFECHHFVVLDFSKGVRVQWTENLMYLAIFFFSLCIGSFWRIDKILSEYFFFWIHLFEEIAHNLWISTEKTANSLHRIQF